MRAPLVLLLAMAAAPGSAPAGAAWVAWELECETVRFPLGGDDWRWTTIEGLQPAGNAERPLAALADRASVLLLLRGGDGPRRLVIEAQAAAGGRSLAAALNGIDLGSRPLRRRWRPLEFPIPPGTIARGPNVVALEVARGRKASEGEPVLLSRITVEPTVECPETAPIRVDPEVVNMVAPDVALVLPGGWTEPSRLMLSLVTAWPPTSLSIHCFDETTASAAGGVAGGQSRRRVVSLRLDGDCARGRGLVLLGEGPEWIDLRRARLGPWSEPRPSRLGAPLAAATVLLALALAGAAALAARRSEAAPPAGSVAAALARAGTVATAALRRPLFWLLAVLWIVFGIALGEGELWSQRIPDTLGYEDFLIEGAREDPLAFSRTLGYPVFLYLTGWELWGIERVAVAHALFYAGAVLVFWLGVAAYARSGWLALAAALPLLASPLLRIVRRVQPDFMGGAASLVVVGLLLYLAARRRSWIGWLVLAAAIFAAYQIRPAVVFLIGFVPLAAVTLWWARHGGAGLRRFAAASLLAALGPFLLYSAVRWARVGHFGLVSYGGFNAIGVTSPMLDEELAASLGPELGPLAEAIVEEKRRVGLPVYEKETPVEFWYENYNRHVWSVAVPVARRLYEPDGPQPGGLVEINDRFTALSFAVIARRPGLYLDWIVRSFAEVTGRAIREPTVRWPAALLAAAGLAAALGRWRSGPKPAAPPRVAPLAGLTLVAVGFYVTHLLLIVSVEEALERYYVATVFLIPCALGALLFETGRYALSAWRGSGGED